MKNKLLIAVFLLIAGCSYQEYNTVNNYNEPVATEKFKEWIHGTYKPLHLPDAKNMVCNDNELYIDLTGFLYDYTLNFNNAEIEQTEAFIKIAFQDKEFTFWRTSNNDIRVDVIYTNTLFELGYFEKI